jgi:hypothetical protein
VARLIDVPADFGAVSPLVVRVGDVLAFAASGGHVSGGTRVLERLGPLLPAVVAVDGRVLVPEGPPSTLLFVARVPGRATLDVITGVPWQQPATTTYVVDVEA